MVARLYPIGDASRLVGVSPGTLRSWERRGLIAPHRSRAGYRLYSRDDLRRLTDEVEKLKPAKRAARDRDARDPQANGQVGERQVHNE